MKQDRQFRGWSVYVSLVVVGDGSRTERSAALSVDSYFRVYSSAATRSNSTSGRPSIPRRCHRPGPKSMPRNATSRNHPLVADLCAIKRCYTRTLFLSLVLSLYVSFLHYTYLYEPLAFVLSFIFLLFLYVVLYFFFLSLSCLRCSSLQWYVALSSSATFFHHTSIRFIL